MVGRKTSSTFILKLISICSAKYKEQYFNTLHLVMHQQKQIILVPSLRPWCSRNMEKGLNWNTNFKGNFKRAQYINESWFKLKDISKKNMSFLNIPINIVKLLIKSGICFFTIQGPFQKPFWTFYEGCQSFLSCSTTTMIQCPVLYNCRVCGS